MKGLISEYEDAVVYVKATKLMDNENYSEAVKELSSIKNYSDAQSKRSTCKARKDDWFFYKKTGGGYYMLYIKYDLDNKLVAFEGYNPNDISLATS